MATSHSISDFINGFGGGTRQNRFKITGTIGNKANTNINGTFDKNIFYVRTATIPNSTLGGIPINYRGRMVVYPGERVYSPWQITVLDDIPDSKNKLFEAFHDWSNNINDHAANTTSNLNPSQQFAKNDWTVEQLNTNGTATIRKFILHHCWPQAVGDLALDMGADNTLVSFAVNIVYSHYTIDDSPAN